MSIFQAQHYREVISQKIEENQGVRAYKTQLARAAACHPSYLSQVLNGSVHLTPEQALRLADFWSLRAEERAFFLDLVARDRAGTPALRAFHQERLEAALLDRDAVADPHDDARVLPPEKQAQYYASWHHQAVHYLLPTPEHGTPEAVAQRLQLPLEVVRASVALLEELGLVELREGRWALTDHHILPPRRSPMRAVNHTHWRLRSIQSLHCQAAGDMHLSYVFNLSRADFPRIQELLARCYHDAEKVVRASGSEDVYVLSLDAFRA